ncbi:hypothetical protein [Domibacillus sp. 8LH]|uniref:hypothetical protein n=1 Tax=Domibacillus sp. 8LH TaxID=3073900 RepID=UPI00319E2676
MKYNPAYGTLAEKAGKAGKMMIKFGWALTVIGLIAILSGLLYPMGVIPKNTFLIMLVAGALVMFIGSMVRTVGILKKK